MHLCQHFSSDHKYAFEADLLIISTYYPAMCNSMCFMQSLVQSAHFKHSQFSGQSQDRQNQEPLKCMGRLSAHSLFHLTDPVALPCQHHVPVLLQQPGGQCVHHPEFPSCPSLSGCQAAAWSKSAGSHQVRKIHRRVTKLSRWQETGFVILAHSHACPMSAFSCS